MDVQQIIAQFIDLLSVIVKQITPDTITTEQKALLQQTVPLGYSAAKFALPPIVAKTPNIIDDAAAMELAEICEDLAAKYNLELNPQNVNLKSALRR